MVWPYAAGLKANFYFRKVALAFVVFIRGPALFRHIYFHLNLPPFHPLTKLTVRFGPLA